MARTLSPSVSLGLLFLFVLALSHFLPASADHKRKRTAGAAAAPPNPLSRAYYAQSCPGVESLVYRALYNATRSDFRLAPRLIRLLFHDCFVHGCDASILLDGLDENPAEKDATPNQTLGGLDFISGVKAEVEKACPKAVSCADVLALAARDSLYLLGGPLVPIRLGRLDGLQSASGDTVGMIPDSAGNLTAVMATFAAKGLDMTDMVALSGAHTIGRGICKRAQKHLAGADAMFSPLYRRRLTAFCGKGADFKLDKEINLDQYTPFRFDNQYYRNVKMGAAMFGSDAALLTSPASKLLVDDYARHHDAFFTQFALSFAKMSEIGIHSTDDGEVRVVCNLPNAYSGNGQ